MNNPPFVFSAVPRLLPLSAYDDARAAMQEAYGRLPGVVDVIEFGTVPNPGISDLDCYVVVEPHAAVTCPSLRSFTEDQQYILEHKPFFIGTSAVASLRSIDPWLIKAVPILGRVTIPSDPIAEEDRHALSFHYITANWLLTFLNFIAKLEGTRIFKVRDFMDTCIGTTYQFRELHRAGASQLEADPDVEVFRGLRNNWFSMPEGEREPALRHAYDTFCRSVGRLAGILSKGLAARASTIPLPRPCPPRCALHRALLREFPRSLISDQGESVFVFQEGRTEVEVRWEVHRSLLPIPVGRMVAVLPLPICAATNIHLRGKGEISRHYTEHLVSDLEAVPILEHPALDRYLEVQARSLDETRNARGAKMQFHPYGWSRPDRRTWRASMGGVHDEMIDRLSRSPFASLVRKSETRLVLPTA